MNKAQVWRSIGAIATSGLLILIAGCGGGSNSGATSGASTGKTQGATTHDYGTLKIGVDGDVLKWSLFYIARHEGYFKKNGFSGVGWTTLGGQRPMAAIAGRSTDLALVAGTNDTFLAAKKTGLVALLGTYRGSAAKFIISDDTLKDIARDGVTAKSSLTAKVKALKGKTFGTTTPGATGDTLMRSMFNMAGLNPSKDIKIVYLNSTSGMSSALSQGNVNIIYSGQPTIATMEVKGKGQVYIDPGKDIPAFQNTEFSFVFASHSAVGKNTGKYVAIVKSLLQAYKLLKASPDKAKSDVQSYFPDLAPAVFNSAWKSTYPAIAASPIMTTTIVGKSIAAFNVKGISAKDILDDSIAQKAQQELSGGR